MAFRISARKKAMASDELRIEFYGLYNILYANLLYGILSINHNTDRGD